MIYLGLYKIYCELTILIIRSNRSHAPSRQSSSRFRSNLAQLRVKVLHLLSLFRPENIEERPIQQQQAETLRILLSDTPFELLK